jgi:alpha-ribazole phosphatase
MNQESKHVTRWWWVRHAPVPDTVNIYGQNDVDSDISDRNVFDALARELPRGAAWFTSNLKRTHQTAEAIIEAMIESDPASGTWVPVTEFAEQHLGEWQGLNRAEFFASRANFSHPFWFGPASERAPGGESFDDLYARVAPAIERLSAENINRDIVAVTHGGTIKAAIGHALKLSTDAALAFAIDNCSITRLDQLGAGSESLWRVVSINHRPWTGMESVRAAAVMA